MSHIIAKTILDRINDIITRCTICHTVMDMKESEFRMNGISFPTSNREILDGRRNVIKEKAMQYLDIHYAMKCGEQVPEEEIKQTIHVLDKLSYSLEHLEVDVKHYDIFI